MMEIRYVGFWARFLAFIVDSVLVLMVILPIAYAVYGATVFELGGPMFTDPVSRLLQFLFPVIAVLLFWVYRSATPGKIMLKARIVDATTLGPPAKWQLLVRYLGYYVSLFTLCLGFLWVAWDSRKQGFHDKLARTVVIYSNSE